MKAAAVSHFHDPYKFKLGFENIKVTEISNTQIIDVNMWSIVTWILSAVLMDAWPHTAHIRDGSGTYNQKKKSEKFSNSSVKIREIKVLNLKEVLWDFFLVKFN